MVNLGKVSCTCRQKAVKEYIARAEYIAQHGKEPPRNNKGGRPKRTRGFQKKTKEKAASPPPSALMPPRFQQRHTCSNSRPASLHKKSLPSEYTAKPDPATRKGPTSEWCKKRKFLQNAIKTLKVSNKNYQKMWYSSLAEIQKMNSELLRTGFVDRIDGPITEDFSDDLSN